MELQQKDGRRKKIAPNTETEFTGREAQSRNIHVYSSKNGQRYGQNVSLPLVNVTFLTVTARCFFSSVDSTPEFMCPCENVGLLYLGFM